MHGYGAEDIRAAESGPLAAGVPLMRRAAHALARTTAEILRERHRPRGSVLVLAGGGNNGGDGLHAAADLVLRGIPTTVLLTRQNVHPGGLDRARRAGARIFSLTEDEPHPPWHEAAGRATVWIDALAGLGVRGGLRGVPAQVVNELSELRRDQVVIAVDAPSGIGADSGALAGPVLAADVTVTFGQAKAGLLLPPAALHVGRLEVVDLGLQEQFTGRTPQVRRLQTADLAAAWPVPEQTGHKYTRGVLGILAGSSQYPGAGILTTGAARATGCGMVRYLGPREVAEKVITTYPDVVPARGRVQALVVGPGIGGAEELDRLPGAIEAVLEESRAEPPRLVWDAGALSLLPAHDHLSRTYPSVLTPHAGELASLLQAYGSDATRSDVEADPARWADLAAQHTGACVLLKGPVTLVACPDGARYSQADGSPWMATAGSGDVLAGILGALAATSGHDLGLLAAAAAAVHGRAGRRAGGGGPITAPDITAATPAVITDLLTRGSAAAIDQEQGREPGTLEP